MLCAFANSAYSASLDRTGTLWSPYIEWSLDNPSYTGNPFDLLATVTFTHNGSGEIRKTEMFYDGGTTWKFRFTGTHTGTWTFTTQSSDPDLNNLSGSVTVNANPNQNVKGFMTKIGNKWARQIGENNEREAFTPQFRLAFTEIPSDWTPWQPPTPMIQYDAWNDLALHNGDTVCFRTKALNSAGLSDYSTGTCSTLP